MYKKLGEKELSANALRGSAYFLRKCKIDKKVSILNLGRELSFYIEGNKKTKMKVASLLALAPYVLGCVVTYRFGEGGGWDSSWEWGRQRICEFRNPRTNECIQYGK